MAIDIDDDDGDICELCGDAGEVECEECGGTGTADIDYEETCDNCHGDGMVDCPECG